MACVSLCPLVVFTVCAYVQVLVRVFDSSKEESYAKNKNRVTLFLTSVNFRDEEPVGEQINYCKPKDLLTMEN